MTTQHLVITAHVQQTPELVSELSKTTSQLACNIDAVRVTALGDHYVINMAVSGAWDAIAKLEASLNSMGERHKATMIHNRFNMREEYPLSLPYSANVTALDEPGLTMQITEFFLNQGLELDELYGESYLTPTGTQMYTLTLNLSIPTDIHIASLRDSFVLYCDNLNIDAVLEPMRF